jgi:hypothetical protein
MLVGLCKVCSEELIGEIRTGSADSAVGETSVASEFFLLGEDKKRDPEADCVRSQIFGFLSSLGSSRLCIVTIVSTDGCRSVSLKRGGVSLAFSLSK